MDNCELFWSAMESISTLLACIIALVLPFILYKLERKRKLIITTNNQMNCNFNNNTNEKYLCIQVTNLSAMIIEIKNIFIVIDKNYYGQACFLQNETNITKLITYQSNKLPIKIDIGDRIVYNFSLEKLKEAIEQEHQLDQLNKNISIVVIDTLNKKYTYKTKHSLSYYIDSLYKE